jgi:C4-dicarboxylate-specific signal transduction histidine kinase
MARNRKNQVAALRFGAVLKALFLCSAIVCACLGYVWLKKQISELGQQLRRREALLRDLHLQNEKLRRQLAEWQSVPFLEQRVKDLKLGLGPPQPAQVWTLPEPPVDKLDALEEQRYAEKQPGPEQP